jgi:monovalent cation:H+ antiporter, CPA1 family
MDINILSIFSLFFLLTIAALIFRMAQAIRIPYTVLLIIFGILLIPLAHLPGFSFLETLTLTPELVFYLLLPVLIFDGAFRIPVPKFIEDLSLTSILALIGLVLSTVLIGITFVVSYQIFGIEFPLLMALLFGSLISATDPVAVLALFREQGAPARLERICEGESLLNDATAMALFVILLGVITQGYQSQIASLGSGVLLFAIMMLGGILFGLIMGALYVWILGLMKRHESTGIMATLALAHLTFISAELLSGHIMLGTVPVMISPIIATMVASLMIGNYGKYKFSPKSEEFLEKFWGQSAFLANSVIFILLGYSLEKIRFFHYELLIALGIGLCIVPLIRYITVRISVWAYHYLFAKPYQKISHAWQMILTWGGLRGVIAITLVLLIPETISIPSWTLTLSPYEWILGVTIGTIIGSLLIHTLSLPWMMKKLGLEALTLREDFSWYEGRLMAHHRMKHRISDWQEKHYIHTHHASILDAWHAQEVTAIKHTWEHTLTQEAHDRNLCTPETQSVRLIRMQAIGIEKYYLKQLFLYEEITEQVYKKILTKLTLQYDTLEHGISECDVSKERDGRDWFERMLRTVKKIFWQHDDSLKPHERYQYYRAQSIISRKVLKEFKERTETLSFPKVITEAYATVGSLYQEFQKKSTEKMLAIVTAYPEVSEYIEKALVRKGVLKTEVELLAEYHKKDLMTERVIHRIDDYFEAGYQPFIGNEPKS